ncbi:energy transducer TonB [Hymenobacter sp. BT664]|uniref:Energy transducer TonB n=2 Tax=Hymenobacter montanus TaxID=2771359 RepID=A0A927GI19_9BACT|nr:energy transducer TonB [Hymenobacter montanus]
MTNAQLATASLNDIIFDGRNRHYGAYELRLLYRRHVTRALAIATTVCALLIASPLVAKLLKDKTPPAPPKINKELTLIAPPLDPRVLPPPPVVPPPAAPGTQPPRASTIRFTPPVVVPNTQPTEDVPDQAALANAHVSTVTHQSTSEADLSELEVVEGPKSVGETVDTKVYISVEQMPELPGGGGQMAIVAAIQRAVKYPSLALRNGVEGKVFVSFTVDPKGEVIDVKIVKGLGSGLDEETVRAIKSLPRFIPGKQNGREVSVSFTVPVTYQIQ